MFLLKPSFVILLVCLFAWTRARPQGRFGFQNEFGGFSMRGNQDAFSVTGNQKMWESNDGRSSVGATTQYDYARDNAFSGIGGGIGYKSPEASISANVNHGRGYDRDLGYNVGVSASKNLFTSDDGQTTVDAVGSYKRHHGGLSGTGDPNVYGGIQVESKF